MLSHGNRRGKPLFGKASGNNDSTFDNDTELFNKDVKTKPRLRLNLLLQLSFTSGVSRSIRSSNPSSNQTGSDWPIEAQPPVVSRTPPANERLGRFGRVRSPPHTRRNPGGVVTRWARLKFDWQVSDQQLRKDTRSGGRRGGRGRGSGARVSQ